MSKNVILINRFFQSAMKEDVEKVTSKIILSDRQKYIFESYYLHKKNVGFIADSLFVSQIVVNKELKKIREKIIKAIYPDIK